LLQALSALINLKDGSASTFSAPAIRVSEAGGVQENVGSAMRAGADELFRTSLVGATKHPPI